MFRRLPIWPKLSELPHGPVDGVELAGVYLFEVDGTFDIPCYLNCPVFSSGWREHDISLRLSATGGDDGGQRERNGFLQSRRVRHRSDSLHLDLTPPSGFELPNITSLATFPYRLH